MTATAASHGAGNRAVRREARAISAKVRPATQVLHPLRETARNVLTGLIGFLPIAFAFIDSTGLATAWPWLASFMAGTAVVARILSTPAAEAWVARYLPWLAARDYEEGLRALARQRPEAGTVTVAELIARERRDNG